MTNTKIAVAKARRNLKKIGFILYKLLLYLNIDMRGFGSMKSRYPESHHVTDFIYTFPVNNKIEYARIITYIPVIVSNYNEIRSSIFNHWRPDVCLVSDEERGDEKVRYTGVIGLTSTYDEAYIEIKDKKTGEIVVDERILL